MTKPILAIGLPESNNNKPLSNLEKDFSNVSKDYYVLLYPYSGEDIKFECFYEKDFNEVKFEELKSIIKKSIESQSIDV